MQQRFDICNGDTTTVGGRVIATSRTDFFDGREVACQADAIWCPKCNATGKIACVGDIQERFGTHAQNSRPYIGAACCKGV
jgi:uncharacterized Zn-binding protein involved in type VI secretion